MRIHSNILACLALGWLSCCDLSAAISASPNPGVIGQPITLLISDETTLVSWLVLTPDFSTIKLTGNPVQFSPNNGVGGYNVLAFIFSPDASLKDFAVIGFAVSDASIDSDLDGVPNELESALGCDPNDSASKPIGTPQVSSVLFIDRLIIRQDSKKSGKDALQLNATFGADTAVSLDGKFIAFQIAGIIRAFKINSAGKKMTATSVALQGAASLTIRTSKNGDQILKLVIRNGSFFEQLHRQPLGLSSTSVSLPIFVVVGDEISANQAFVSSKERNGRTTTIGKSISPDQAPSAVPSR